MDKEVVGKTLYIFRRLREPSTHAAIAGLLAVFGQNIPDATWNSIVNGLAVLFGVIGVFVKEGKPETDIKF